MLLFLPEGLLDLLPIRKEGMFECSDYSFIGKVFDEPHTTQVKRSMEHLMPEGLS